MSTQVPMELSGVVDLDTVRRQKTVGDAIRLSRQLAGLEPKQVFGELGITKSVWSDIEGDKRSFPFRGSLEDLRRFRDLVGNDVVPFYLTHCAGFDPSSLRVYESAVEAENRELRQKVAALEAERETIETFIRRTGVRP